MDRTDLLDLLRPTCPTKDQGVDERATRLGHVAEVAPLAYLHSLPPPLSSDDIAALQSELSVFIPPSFKTFLAVSNGLNLFVSSLSLFGWRRSFTRDPGAPVQPFCILTPNREERPRQLDPLALIVGSYHDDHSPVVMTASQASITCFTPDCSTVRETWPDFDTFLTSEVRRLAAIISTDYAKLRIGVGVRAVPGPHLPGDVELPLKPAPRRWWRFW